MSRRPYIVATVLLLSLLAGKLLLTPVQDPPVESSWPSYERARGWPWPYSQSIKTYNPEMSRQAEWQPLSFSYALLLADLVMLLTMLAAVAALLRRRFRRFGRLLQFSLGEMLALVTIAAIACGWASLRYRQWHLEQQTFANFPDALFDTRAEYRGPEWLRRIVPGDRLRIFNRITEVTIDDSRPADESATLLIGGLPSAPYVHSLILHADLASQLTDATPFSNIDKVYFFSNGTPDVVDDGLVAIADWPNLRTLTIEVGERSYFSDRSLAAFGGSKTLEDLTIAEGQLFHVTNAGFARLARAPRLNSLTLPETKLTDAALKSLAEMPALKYLGISGFPNVTSEGIRNLADSNSLVSVAFPGHPRFSDESLKLLASRVKDVYLIQSSGAPRRIQSP